MIDKGRTWMKLTGAYLDTKVGPPAYADAVKVAQSYFTAGPERMVWGTDWPRPTEKEKPDDAVLFDLLAAWTPSDADCSSTTRLRSTDLKRVPDHAEAAHSGQLFLDFAPISLSLELPKIT
jgi:hypothetical protein